MLRFWEHSQVFHPSREFQVSGAALRRPFEDVFFKTSDKVELNAWYFPADSNLPQRKLVFLISHGNGGNIANRLDLYGALLGIGVSVFAFDYRGYGRSQGRPSEAGTYLDAQAAHQWLQAKGFCGKQIVAYGESLGGGVASELSIREETCGLVLQSTFTSIPEVGADIYPWLPIRWISTIKYDTLGRLPRIRVPVLVVHARDDNVIGIHHAERNFAAANEPKLFWEIQGAHNDPLNDPRRFIAGIKKFLTMVESAAAE